MAAVPVPEFVRAGVTYRVDGASGPMLRRAVAARRLAHAVLPLVLWPLTADHVYMASEFPFEPYYIGRIMSITAEPPEERPVVSAAATPAAAPMDVDGPAAPAGAGARAGRTPSPAAEAGRERPRRVSSSGAGPSGSSGAPGKKKGDDSERVVAPSVPPTWNVLVRINWYQRAKDVAKYTQRRSKARMPEPQVLLATMHSDVNPADAVRGKCVVTYMGDVRNTAMGGLRAQPTGR